MAVSGGDFCSIASFDGRQALAERQLARLAAHESKIRAFVCHDAQSAPARVAGCASGPLSGALVGVKDIFTTAEFSTRCGLSADGDSVPRADAWAVARTRELGGVILGKTVCTTFGMARPGPTRNPRDPRRTPGGSSSGSAAAVAASFVSFALGSQTAGSTIRPASYCGITGYKPTYGLLPTAGMAALSVTLDHIGIFARSPRDAWYFASALALSQAETVRPRKPRRLLVLLVPSDVPIGDGYPERIAELARALTWDGFAVDTVDLPFSFDDFANLQKLICYWEVARILSAPGSFAATQELKEHFAPYLDLDIAQYANARRRQISCQAQFQALADPYDAVLMPAATGAAPLTLADTGDAVLNRFWTALHVPVLSVPIWKSEHGIPLGLQVIGKLGEDRSLCEIAQWLVETYAAENQNEFNLSASDKHV